MTNLGLPHELVKNIGCSNYYLVCALEKATCSTIKSIKF